MELKFQVVETKLRRGFIVLKCKNLSIPDRSLDEVRDNPLSPTDVEGMTEKAIEVMQRKMGARFMQQRNRRHAYIPVTKQEYQNMGKPTVGEKLSFKIQHEKEEPRT